MNNRRDPFAHLINQAISLHQSGRLADAEAIYNRIIEAAPNHAEALGYLGLLRCAQREVEDGVRLLKKSLRINRRQPLMLYNLGDILIGLEQFDEALSHLDRAIAINADFPDTHMNRGCALDGLERFAEALKSYDRAIALKPDYAEAYSNRGKTLNRLKRYDEAVASCDRAIGLNPAFAGAYCNKGNALDNLGRYEEALAEYDKALALHPAFPEAHYNRGLALANLRRHEAAIASYDAALALRPDLPRVWFARGKTLLRLKRHAEAADAFARVLELDPAYLFAKGALAHQKMLACDWDQIEPLVQSIERDIAERRKVAEPFGWQGLGQSSRSLQLCAEIYTAALYPKAQSPATVRDEDIHNNEKIRIGYASGEFREQATSYLIAGMIERHDASRFDIILFDNGYDDGGETRRRINKAAHKIVDISALSDADAARAIREHRIDILVNLNGFFGEHRMGVFARRPAPVQVNYLGFPGTLGADYIDYIVADRHVIPPDEQQFYNEHVVYLPDSYQANDSRRLIADLNVTRSDCGLSDDAFVFCCFNNNYKITPDIFDIWMRLLRGVDRGMMWLIEDNASAAENLRKEAEKRGVAADRIVFAPRIASREHLARHRLADLFLDTLPSNAHTTASDALWAGLPLLTCMGGAFPGRVAASLLSALGVPELITRSLADYEALALRLAREPALLSSLKQKVAQNRNACPLYDTARFTRHMEAAYRTMWTRARRREPPEGFAVEPIAD